MQGMALNLSWVIHATARLSRLRHRRTLTDLRPQMCMTQAICAFTLSQTALALPASMQNASSVFRGLQIMATTPDSSLDDLGATSRS